MLWALNTGVSVICNTDNAKTPRYMCTRIYMDKHMLLAAAVASCLWLRLSGEGKKVGGERCPGKWPGHRSIDKVLFGGPIRYFISLAGRGLVFPIPKQCETVAKLQRNDAVPANWSQLICIADGDGNMERAWTCPVLHVPGSNNTGSG